MDNTVFFSGRARLGAGCTAEKVYGVLTVGLEVDMNTGEILDGDCTLSTDVAKRFFSSIVIGYSLNRGIEGLLSRLNKRYHGETEKALGAALKNIYRDYQNVKKQ